MSEYKNLSPEEAQAHETRKKEKKNLFVLSDSFEYRAWLNLLKQLNSLEDENIPPVQKAELFTNIFLDTYTGSEIEEIKELPAFALVDLFERSFGFFNKDISNDQKKELIDLDLSIMHDQKLPEEVRNIVKGIWGFYTDPERLNKIEDEGEKKVRLSFLEAIRAFRKPYEENRELLKELPEDKREYLFLPEENSWKLFEPQSRAHELLYFSGLYEKTVRPLQPELEGAWIKQVEPRHEGRGSESHEETVPMSPHDRLFTFYNDRVPRDETIDAHRVQFCMTVDPEVLKEIDREHEVIGDQLPAALMDYFRNRTLRLRLSNAYREADADTRRQARRLVERAFVNDIWDIDSELMLNIKSQNVLTSDELEGLRKLSEKYLTHNIEDVFIVFKMAFNRELDSASEPQKIEKA